MISLISLAVNAIANLIITIAKAVFSMLTWFFKAFFHVLKLFFCFLPLTSVTFVLLLCVNVYILFSANGGLLALGTGGFLGLGLGKSVQKNLYLPEPMNDFILSIIGEELGLVGVFFLMSLFMLLIWRCFKVAMHAPDRYGMLLSGGVAIMIALQVILNVAVVTSSMPPTGVALPFISYGGNALWICMGAIGVVLNVSRQSDIEAVEKAAKAEKEEKETIEFPKDLVTEEQKPEDLPDIDMDEVDRELENLGYTDTRYS